jgi:hypothetical protein
MGRGLSNLQKRILMLVYEKRQERDFEEEERKQKKMREDPTYQRMLQAIYGKADLSPYSISNYPDAYHSDLIGALYDWRLRRSYWERDGRCPSEGGKVLHGGQNFDRRDMGAEEYNRRTASYYRAVGRLKRRGLLKTQRHGLLITDEGMRVGESYWLEEAASAVASSNH